MSIYLLGSIIVFFMFASGEDDYKLKQDVKTMRKFFVVFGVAYFFRTVY